MTLAPSSSRGSGGLLPTPAVTLPGAPTNGLQALLTDSVTAPTYQWLLVYDTTISGTSKWRFVGGSPLVSESASGTVTPNVSASYVDANSGAFPSLTVPVAGSYILGFGGSLFASVQASTPLFISPKLGAAATADADGFRLFFTVANQVFGNSRSVTRTLAASAVVKLQMKATGTTGTGILENSWLYATPVLLGP